MATKRQHFVPRVYMKAWETQAETSRETKYENLKVCMFLKIQMK